MSLFANSGDQHNCVVFLFCLSSSCVLCTLGWMPVSLDCPFLVAPLVFLNVYIAQLSTQKHEPADMSKNRAPTTHLFIAHLLYEATCAMEKIYCIDILPDLISRSGLDT